MAPSARTRPGPARRALAVVALAAVALAAVAAVLAVPAPAGAAPADNLCAQQSKLVDPRPVPWAQRLLGAERAWPFTQGRGVGVAVLDSGIDPTHPMLSGRIVHGVTVSAGDTSFADTDCAGTGTQMAGVIDAAVTANVGFHGVAPEAAVLSVRVVGAGDSPSSAEVAGADVLAAGLVTAANAGAKIIVIGVIAAEDTPALRAAVAAVQARDIVVIAATGDRAGAQADPTTTWPAAYPGVVGVSAVDESMAAWSGAQLCPDVDLVAPGAAVDALALRQGIVTVNGTRIAAAFVAGAAALVRARFPRLSAAQVVARLEATATPAGGGRDSRRFGYGLVNPYAAVTDLAASGDPVPLPAMRPSVVGAAQQARAAAWSRSLGWAAVAVGVTAVLVLVILAVGAVLPRGRRRRWRSTYAAAPVAYQEPDEPPAPMELFSTGTGTG